MRPGLGTRVLVASCAMAAVQLLGGCTSTGSDEQVTETTADFESERSAPADGLTDVDWVFALVEVDGTPIEPPPDNRTSMTLRTDGTVVGGGGCNEFSGRWKTSNETTIEFEALETNDISCGEIEDWTTAVGLLESLDTWQIDDLTLVLTNADGDRIVAVAS